jgi:L-lactate dehydrogenase complex protein LldF
MSSALRERNRAMLEGGGSLRHVLGGTLDALDERRTAALDELDDAERLRDLARDLRRSSIARLPELLERFADRAEAAGAHVHFAADGQEARAAVIAVASEHAARLVTKAKSMVCEEIGLNSALEAAGMRVLETDLGEWAQQLDGEPPIHIVGPALHKDLTDWQRVLAGAGYSGPSDPRAMTEFARKAMRAAFPEADLGITGVNFAVSETGTLAIVSNEGNARMCSGVPSVHIAVMGMERVVASWSELDVLLSLLSRSANGQSSTAYVNLITGPRRRRDEQGPEELHIVIVDNGRSDLLGSDSQEALHCIRCGACLNACPVFRHVGGHGYATTYSGPIGAVITPFLSHEPGASELPYFSSLCGACTLACPVRIPLHELLLAGRARATNGAGAAERTAWRLWAHAWSNARVYALSGAGLGAPASASLLPPPFRNWSKGRTMIRRRGSTFRARWKKGEVLDRT